VLGVREVGNEDLGLHACLFSSQWIGQWMVFLQGFASANNLMSNTGILEF
jgi:hypothetical protein